ncbi:MAG: hypothetical protein IT462_13245 [Planctomycetes bacterium]|nr:hypothetical protein [Planctomycetota bacterium]
MIDKSFSGLGVGSLCAAPSEQIKKRERRRGWSFFKVSVPSLCAAPSEQIKKRERRRGWKPR